MLGDDDRRVGIGDARHDPEVTLPRSARRIQFRLRAAPLRQHPARLRAGQMEARREQSIERRKGARADHVEWRAAAASRSAPPMHLDTCRRARAARRRLQESRPACARDSAKRDLVPPMIADTRPGKPRARTRVDPAPLGRRKREQAAPSRRCAAPRSCSIVEAAIRFCCAASSRHEPTKRSSRSNVSRGTRPQASRAPLLGHAASRRLWTRIAASAAGVIPRIRAAAPSVVGRAASAARPSRSTGRRSRA